jgi:hypothetical protein
MTREHPPCAECARFITVGHAAAVARGEGWCEGWEAYKPAAGQIGVLFLERGSRAAAEAAKSTRALLVEQRQRLPSRVPQTTSPARRASTVVPT